ncbi:hypothetical protein CCGE525_02380 [Rhizobium jaguaris]|uniref:Uncharacterized protein n=1 Tax=Rhizobium jaguaris TaxID=1312183 RepID=A0A387FR98_9HYPH|nr:hypothetical protein CCGE525_02380 [Rhizobium jaguaris]
MGSRRLSAPDVGAVSFFKVRYFWERHLPNTPIECAPSCIPAGYRNCFLYAKVGLLNILVFLMALLVNNWMRNSSVMGNMYAKMMRRGIFAYKPEWISEA